MCTLVRSGDPKRTRKKVRLPGGRDDRTRERRVSHSVYALYATPANGSRLSLVLVQARADSDMFAPTELCAGMVYASAILSSLSLYYALVL